MTAFSKILLSWYQQNKRILPWRETKNPYNIWLSEIILQQTRIDQGTSYYLKFIQNYPTINNLAADSESAVLKLWQGLGYYSRARNLHHSAKYIANELKGIFPNSYIKLLELKGVGEYTAAAIASICFNEPKAVVDGNVYRVLARYFGIQTPINSSLGIKEFKQLAQSLIDNNNPGDYNQAIMEFGALHCKPQNPLCSSCPLQKKCKAHHNEIVSLLPVKEQKLKVKKRFFNYLVIENNSKTILNKRTEKGIWQHLYEFPLIETSNTVNQEEITKSSIFKNYISKNSEIELFNQNDWVHKLTHQHLHTKFWIVNTHANSTDLVSWKKVKKLPVPQLIQKFIDAYIE